MSLLAARAARPIVEQPGRSLGWWGSVAGIVALAHFVGGILVAAVYIRAASASWPPQPGPAPGMVESGVAVAVTIVAAVAATVADRRVRRGGSLGELLLVLTGVLAVIAAALRGSVTVFSDWPVTDHAFWSVRWALGAMDLVLLGTLAVIALFAALQVGRGLFHPGEHAELAIVTLWSWSIAVFVLASWSVAMATSVWWG